MQRVVSGEDIRGQPEYYPFSDRDQVDVTMTMTMPGIDNDNSNNNINNGTFLSHSPPIDSNTAAHFVESDGDCGNDNDNDNDYSNAANDTETTMQVDDSNNAAFPSTSTSTSASDSIITDPPSMPSSVPMNVDDNEHGNININSNINSNNYIATAPAPAHHEHEHEHHHNNQQSPLSIISGLLPAVGLRSTSRNDSRNSGTMSSLGSAMQRSQNSSRDWGWFEDVHHMDQSVTGGGHHHHHHPTSSELSRAASRSLTNKTSVVESNSSTIQQQNQSTSRETSLRSSLKYSNGGTTTNGTNSGIVNVIENSSGSSNNPIMIGGEVVIQNDNSSSSNGLEPRHKPSKSNAASLLPMGDEMFIDEMQEFLEPILVDQRPRDMENEAAVQAVTAPHYVLEESISDQLLWKKTAGNRPPQPVDVRAYFEQQWAENFAKSEVKYELPTEVLTATTPIALSPFSESNFGTGGSGVIGTGVSAKQDVADIVSSFVVPGGMAGGGHGSGQHNPHLATYPSRPKVVRSSSGSGGNLTVHAQGDNVFGTTVSKSFPRPSVNGELVSGVDTVNISVASYRVVESEKRGKHAQFLVIYREGSIRDMIGVWKRYSDFQELSRKVTKVHEGCASVIANMSPLAVTEEHDVEHLPNAITSWHLLKKRKRWYRCLDSGYLSLKAFLLERFLHDILFESSTPDLLRDFVGVPPPR